MDWLMTTVAIIVRRSAVCALPVSLRQTCCGAHQAGLLGVVFFISGIPSAQRPGRPNLASTRRWSGRDLKDRSEGRTEAREPDQGNPRKSVPAGFILSPAAVGIRGTSKRQTPVMFCSCNSPKPKTGRH
jgi:hypothetical protein